MPSIVNNSQLICNDWPVKAGFKNCFKYWLKSENWYAIVNGLIRILFQSKNNFLPVWSLKNQLNILYFFVYLLGNADQLFALKIVELPEKGKKIDFIRKDKMWSPATSGRYDS